MTRKIGIRILVALIYFFLWLPIALLLIFSFNIEPFPSSWSQFSFECYKALWNSPHLWRAFTNSLIIATSSMFLAALIGSALIFYAAQGGRVKKYISLFYGSLVIPEIVLGVILLSFFSTISIPLGVFTLIIAHTVLGLGFVVPNLYAHFTEIDTQLIEASLALGATPVRTFFKIILPLLRSPLIATSLLVFITSFDDFVLAFFCSGSSFQTLSLYILSMVRSGISPIINALSTILIVVSSLIAIFYFHFNSRRKISR